jgi:predicted peroxiredoxin
MSKNFFVKIVSNPETDLRKAIVGLACAAEAIREGHKVSLFFAADGVKMLNSEYIETINSSGTIPEGMILNIMNTVTEGATAVYCSTGSQAANGVTKENAAGILLEGYADWMTWSGPPGVVALSAASEIQLVY